MNTISYLLLRLGIGASMFGHGLVRLPKLEKFSGWMMGTFEKSMLPTALVKPFSYALPIAEFLVGLLLIAGLFTRQAAVLGGIVMLSLIFGTTMIEGWDFLTGQLVHLVFFAVLLQFISSNTYALDNLLKK
ncbi:DoxX family protein [Chitinophaga sp. Cy-1792]|uniref:DoxX family protein n=1 Tax=Chitinophaga sp. Cy-1792 TaxID=2608339 RepID=UPI00142169FF|nr:DoxX family protein [Chitinophaga sp. Cy-1792]NIG55636.1 DoxX family protein [Chitinophaga sp. Cy-1792]